MLPDSYHPISYCQSFQRLSVILKAVAYSNFPTADWFNPQQAIWFLQDLNNKVISKLSDMTNRKQSTGAILLDVSKALDKVWHELLYKLSLPPTCYVNTEICIIFFCDHTSSDQTFSITSMGLCSSTCCCQCFSGMSPWPCFACFVHERPASSLLLHCLSLLTTCIITVPHPHNIQV